jgi:hypothetical protein
MDDLLDAALNTYRVLVMCEDPFDIIDGKGGPFMFDVSEYPYVDYDTRIKASISAMEVLEYHEHYEKCADLQEYIKEVQDGVQGLST